MTRHLKDTLITLAIGSGAIALLVVGALRGQPGDGARPAVSEHPAHPAPTTPREQRDALVLAAAARAGVSGRLALAVSHVENPGADSAAVSKAGAVGLMQVLPKYWAHAFEEECGCGSLMRRERNVCVGVRALQEKLVQTKTTREALCAYHGSLLNYPTACQKYASDVLDALVRLP